jgi:cation diffusion facilitator CzcD-associated flavoprotein CzcO
VDSYSRWSNYSSSTAEVQIYAEELVGAYQLGIHLRLAEAATEATWDAEACQWHLITESGREILADAVIAALGQLNRPAFPSIEGLDRFEGPTRHSARWNDDVLLPGKRVGVVGSAASAVQLIPEVAKEAAALTVFQRSANYVIPKIERTVD